MAANGDEFPILNVQALDDGDGTHAAALAVYLYSSSLDGLYMAMDYGYGTRAAKMNQI